jgi:hypothetical protein
MDHPKAVALLMWSIFNKPEGSPFAMQRFIENYFVPTVVEYDHHVV